MNKFSLISPLVFLALPFTFRYIPGGLLSHEIAFWALLALIMVWIYFGEKRTITSIGWKDITPKTIVGGIGLGLILFILLGIAMTVIQAVGLELNQDVALMFAGQPWWVLSLIVMRAAIVEEVLYRGFAFERLFEATNSKWVAELIPVICFMLAHLAWGIGHLLFIFMAGGLFMLVYITRRNLPLLIVAHFTTDVLALMVLPALVGE